MKKVKTTINIDEGLWKKFSHLIIEERGYRKKNEVIENLIQQYVDQQDKCSEKRIKNAIILAAGIGSRLKPLTSNIPKCLLTINRITILEHQVNNLEKCGIEDITIIIGYKAIKVKEFCQKQGWFFNIIEDRQFQDHNNLFSLWVAQKKVPGGFICLNGDVVFDENIVKNLLNCKDNVCLAVDHKECTEEDMKVKVAGDFVKKINKKLFHNEVYGEFTGISFFSEKGAQKLKEMLAQMSDTMLKNAYVATAIQKLIDSDVPVYSHDIGDRFWADIDFVEDLNQVRDYFTTREG